MLLNYHELTVNQPKNTAAERQQNAVVVAIMVAGFSYIVMTSGAMLSIEPTMGIFPGGSFCYKIDHRDYAASMGMGRQVMMDATRTAEEHRFTNVERRQVEHMLHHVFLDNPFEIEGRDLRWATGMLVGGDMTNLTNDLMALNTQGKKKKREPTAEEVLDLSAEDIMNMLPYHTTHLPSVDSLVLQFPHSHGFGSALVTSYKVIPVMRKEAKKRGVTHPVVISTCSKAEQMCTIYVPLEKTDAFLLGKPASDTYQKMLPEYDPLFSYKNFKQTIRRMAGKEFVENYFP